MQDIMRQAAEVFRENVRSVMESRDLNITELAILVGTSRPGMSRILSGEDGVTIERAERIAKALRIPLQKLFSKKLEMSGSSA